MAALKPPDPNSFSSVDPAGAICTRAAASEPSLRSRMLRTKATLLSPSPSTAIFFVFFKSASDLIFLLPGPIRSSTSCSRMASARGRGGTLASVRNTARSACLRSNCVSALALSALNAIVRRSRDEVFLSTAASLAAMSASSLLASPTANVSVSELRSQTRPPATVATVRIRVSSANSSTCRRLLVTTCERGSGGSADGVRTSALMAYTHCRDSLPQQRLKWIVRRDRKCLKKNDNFRERG
jgi:hypothetical protein